MKLRIVIIISCLICFACTNVSLQLPDEVDWVYYNQKMFDERLGGHKCEYQVEVVENNILVKSFCSEQCDIINSNGIFVDTTIYDTIPFKNNMEYLGGKNMYVWDPWEFNVKYIDKSRVTELSYISKPTERLKLLSGRRPKREHRIKFVLDDKEYSVRLPSEKGSTIIYNVCQYDETHFLFSVNMRIDGINYRPTHYYYYSVLMINLEDLSRKRFLGIKL